MGSARMHRRAVNECYTGSALWHATAAPGDTAWVTRPTRAIAAALPVPGGMTLLATALLVGWVAALAWATMARAASSEASDRDLAARGPYEVETRDIRVPRGDGDDAFEARLFTPLAPGDGAPAADERSPVYAFGHGYLAPVGPYTSTLEHLASWGITVVAPRSGRALFPSHERFAADLLASLDAVAEAAAADDWAGLPVDPKARAVGGHSMGGGAAILAAASDPSVRTMATLTAADTRPSAVEAARELDVPLLLVAASEDAITPVEQHQRPMFEAAGGPAQLRIIEGGGHCGFLDQSDLIGLVCGRPSLDPDTQRAHGRATLTAWLRGQLMDDAEAAALAARADPAGGDRVEVRGEPQP